jgi:glycosyltransferase involved in cell wall biosynthesis
MNPPEISVVLATQNVAEQSSRCLDSLRNQTLSECAEIIVADASTDGTDEMIRSRYPGVRLIHFDRPLGLPQLTREALRQARGRVLVVTDPYCVFPPDWLEKMRKAHETDFPVIGGAVEKVNCGGLLSWACYFADYGPFMLPASRQVTPLLAGNHVSYKRWVIKPKLDSMEDGFWKVFFHADLTRQGIRFLFEPDLVVHYSRPDTLLSFLRRYFRHAHFFAAFRCRRISPAGRFLRLVSSPALPAVLFYQRLRAGWKNKRHRSRFLKSLPLLAVFVTVWAAGEFTGYLLGPDSVRKEVYD